jgi:hypothetical protein
MQITSTSVPRWIPGTEYARMLIRSGGRVIVGTAFERAGLAIDHERYVVHREPASRRAAPRLRAVRVLH